MINKLLSEFAVKPAKVGKDEVQKSEDLGTSITSIANAVILVLGIVAVVVIIYGGIQYMTSSGDAGKVKKAKDTILYGVIGLIIAALAFAIVNFVIGTILKDVGNDSVAFFLN